MTISESIAAAVEGVKGDLAGVRGALDFAATAVSMRPQLGAMLNWDGLDAERKKLAQEFMRAREASLEDVARGLFVNVAGSYEEFLRLLVRIGVEGIASKAAIFDEVPVGHQQRNMYWTGRALQSVSQPRSYIKLDYYRVCGDIGTCTPGSRNFRLNSDVVALEITMPNAEGLEKILDRIGIAKFWDDLGRDRRLQRALGTAAVRETCNLAKTWIDTFVETRNSVVHVGRGGATVVESYLREVLAVVEALCEALGSLVVARLG